MKPLQADALLPFAIAAILGFLVLGLRGERSEPARVKAPTPVLAIPFDYEVQPERKLPHVRAQVNPLPPS